MNNLINNLKCISRRPKFDSLSNDVNKLPKSVMVALLHNISINGRTYNDLKFVQLRLNCVNDKMSKRYNNNGIPPRKIPRMFGPFGIDFLPPLPHSLPPPPLIMNCGELREQHHGAIVEMDGKVNKSRLGRFIELKDQHGATQLVAPPNNANISKRFANMPLNSFITIVGQVKRRPANLKNFSMPTGEVEVHVNNIIRVQKMFHPGVTANDMRKRSYSTMASTSKNEKRSENTVITAITGIECKHIKNNDNLVQWFMNRKHTCGSLRIQDAGKNVALVGWVDKRQAKFVHLMDGYGSMQILIEDETLKTKLDTAADHDLVLINGRVLARPQTHITHNSQTGNIELYAEDIVIIDANSVHDDTNQRNGDTSSTKCANGEAHSLEKPDVNKFTFRTHNCGELRDIDIGKEVTICGWMEFSRMNRFFTLRDGYGHIQIIVPEQLMKSVNCDSISFESILKVNGRVIPRPLKMVNPKMETGAIEVELMSLEVLNEASTDLPVQVREFNRSNENNRLKYRYIDLRFPDMQRNLRIRSNILMKMREYLINSAGFVEVETPTLFRRTPGGAQEFVVPSQKPGLFYSLVQSPQQFKQMLMAGAIDRYFQIARCYRDETTTLNRQPEFTQLDIELSFTQPNDIMNLIENVFLKSWPRELNAIIAPFRRMTFSEAMDRYGSDKPDTRYTHFLLQNVTAALNETESDSCKNFSAYAIALQDNYASGFTQPLELGFKASAQQKNINFATIRVDENGKCENVEGLNEDQTKVIISELNLQPKDVAFLAFGEKSSVQTLMGKWRLDLISNYTKNGIIPKVADDVFEFLWVVDFPLFTSNEETGHLETTHHPFTAPHPDDLHLLESPDTYDLCRSQAYDIVLNGQEIGGGSIRIHNAKFQKQILDDILQLKTEHLSHLIAALESGCPPHGGIALGLDRLLSIMCSTNSIRDVMAFPKSSEGKDPLSKAPCEISKEELELYHLQIKK